MSTGSMAYWVRICQRGTVLGAGFILTPYHVLTAAHCLGRVGSGDQDVELVLETGEEIPGRVFDLAAGADLALIILVKPLAGAFDLPQPDMAVHGDKWFAPYRPGGNDPHLEGHVVGGRVSYQCEAGENIEALQLNCKQHVGSFHGYSGGPIERRHKDPSPALIGILLEQYLDRQDGSRASDVLFAATIREALRRFRYLGAAHFLNVLSGDEGLPGQNAPVQVSPHSTDSSPAASPRFDPLNKALESRIAEADSLLRAMRGWAMSELILPQIMEEGQRKIIFRLTES
jgi:hypothetical protein